MVVSVFDEVPGTWISSALRDIEEIWWRVEILSPVFIYSDIKRFRDRSGFFFLRERESRALTKEEI